MNAPDERPGHLDDPRHGDDPAADRAARFGQLPHRILPEQMIEESPTDPPSDPLFGRNPDNDWLIRYCA